MLKVLKNLKNSWVSVLIIVILLCIQATADLALPDYTSRIVNVGIQNGGIKAAAPEVISEQDMENILFFTDADDQILENYDIVEENPTKEQEKKINKYVSEELKNGENRLYVIKDLEEEQLSSLVNLISGPLVEYSAVTNEETENQIKDQILQNMTQNVANDGESIGQTQNVNNNVTLENQANLESISVMDMLKQMPEAQREAVLEEFTSYVSQMADSIKEQAAISSVKTIYSNLGADTDKLQNDYILLSGFQMLGVALVSMVSAVSIMLLSSRVAAKLGQTLRDKVFKKVLSFSTAELREFSTASLITRSTNDIQQIQQLITFLFRVVVYAPIIGIGGFVKVLTTSDNAMAWIIGVAILAILFVVGTLFIVAMPKFKKLQDLIDKLNQVSREILTGLPVIRAFNKEKKEEEQ